MPKIACYVDGFNLYHAIDALGKPKFKWLNLKALAATFLRPGEELTSVVYFSAVMVWDREKCRRHREYIAALRESGVEPVISKFQKSNKHCQFSGRYCDFREEKQTDVAIASRMIADVMTDGLDRILLVTADSDQVPAIAAIRGLNSRLEISIGCPPGRAGVARELQQVCHTFTEISDGRIERCLFPRNVRNARGTVVARAPAAYEIPNEQPN